MILIAARILIGSLQSIIHKDYMEFSWFFVVVCVITIIVKLFLFLYSNKLAKKGQLDYSNNRYKGKELGEILFYNEIGECDAESIIEAWYKDAKDFRYHNKNQMIFHQFQQYVYYN